MVKCFLLNILSLTNLWEVHRSAFLFKKTAVLVPSVKAPAWLRPAAPAPIKPQLQLHHLLQNQRWFGWSKNSPSSREIKSSCSLQLQRFRSFIFQKINEIKVINLSWSSSRGGECELGGTRLSQIYHASYPRYVFPSFSHIKASFHVAFSLADQRTN